MASNTIIQCTTSLSNSVSTYDVFVSFHGEDTRNSFIGFLFQALHRKGFDAFKDDKHLKKGEFIAPELLQAIQGSRIFVVLFSKNYASSTWCLRELVEICHCFETSPRQVLPIFYDVDPSEVRKQSGCYEKAFAEHEERFREDKEKMEEVKTWREALTLVANLSGWDIRNKPQYIEIEEIVEKIRNALGHKFSSLPNDGLVGMESRVEELEKLLHFGLVNDVRVAGISGMNGIGKTTLGHALYERISQQYDFHCFVDDVSKIYRDSGTLGVQKQLLCQSLDEKNLEICNVSEGTCLVWARLHHVRALIVLDNVTHVEQLNMFTGSRETLLRECLGGGSRIIIISRDQHILRTHGVDDFYQVHPLNQQDAVKLFCRKAFKSNDHMSDYKRLTYEVLSHAQGHPLAIKVIGSSLFGRDVLQWRSALARLRENKSKNIIDVLRISFDELEKTEKEIFLDIACFFNNFREEYVKEFLNFRGFHPEYGLQVLSDKSLITIVDGWVEIHSLLIDLGKCIVQEKSPREARKWSRLWDYKDFHKVMSDNMATKNLEAIDIDGAGNLEKTIAVDALSKMGYLKMLMLENVKFSGRLNHLSNKLGYLAWIEYPFERLPLSFQPDNLVHLVLCNSNIKQLWEGKKSLHNLKYLDLSDCKNLIDMPDLGEALSLEYLDLNGCIQLRHIDPSISLLKKLFYFNLGNCKNLVSLSDRILGLHSLEYLNLSSCSKLYNIWLLDEPWDTKHLKKLNTCEASIYSQPVSSYSRSHKDSISCSLPTLPIFPCICELSLSFCNLVQIPDAIGYLYSLEWLDLSGNNFATLPSLKHLSKMFLLKLQHCKQLKYLPELPSQIDFPSQTSYKFHVVHPIPIRDDAGLYIFNCPELFEKEHCNSLGISWIIQILQHHVYQLYKIIQGPTPGFQDEFFQSDSFRLIESVTPGSEIPKWFNNQHVNKGSYISIDTSPVMHDNNCIAIACCAVFVVSQETVSDIRPSKMKEFPIPVYLPVDFYGDLELVSDETDHMWLFIVHRPRSSDNGCLHLKCIVKSWEFVTPSTQVFMLR